MERGTVRRIKDAKNMAHNRTPRRHRLGDRLITPDGHETPGPIAIDHIVARFDRAVEAMDAKWGVDRLVGLFPSAPPAHVPPERAADYLAIPRRYGEAVENLNRVIAANDVAAVETWTERAVKGLAVLDRQCGLAGIARPDFAAHHATIDGTRYVIVQDVRDAAEAERQHPGATVLTALQCAIDHERAQGGMAMLGECRRQFPDAAPKPDAARALAAWDVGDPIPFGDDE